MNFGGKCAQFAVVRRRGGWQVRRDGHLAGDFDFEIDAFESALRQVRNVRRRGLGAALLVEGADGRLRPHAPEIAAA